MAKRILVIDGDDRGHFFLSVDGSTVVIGDRPNHAEALLRGLHISRIHCEVEVDDEAVAVDGAPGTLAGARQDLRVGGAVHVGHSRLRLEPGPGGSAFNLPTPTAVIPAASAPAAAPVEAGAAALRLTVIDGADKGRHYSLPTQGSVTIGNSPKHADIVLHDLYVARIHAGLDVEGGAAFVHPTRADSSVQIGVKVITARQQIHLGEVIRVGNSYLRLEVAPPAPAEEAPAEVPLEEIAEEPARAVEPSLEGQLLGHFRIGSVLGHGYSGAVYRATDLKT